jgi:hypothetical protein
MLKTPNCSKIRLFAEEEAKKLDSESKDKSESKTRDGYDTLGRHK